MRRRKLPKFSKRREHPTFLYLIGMGIRYLIEVLDALISGKEVPYMETPAVGCTYLS